MRLFVDKSGGIKAKSGEKAVVLEAGGRVSRPGEMGAAGDGVYLCGSSMLYCTNRLC